MIQKCASFINDSIAIRPMDYLSYAFVHCILDSASADTILAHVMHALESWPDS